jgi:ketosteroid isomerase-like protein
VAKLRERQMRATELAEHFPAAWQARDERAWTRILAENVTFRGPLGSATGRDLRAIAGGAQ